ncbi:hypothetical protein IFM89_012238 [Coptis chinensis]|uniref:Myb/SANT-like DNA-binding domain-containing protein n=1 Tax=Coptis chinensis TaxID=261450 RepID=A0A835HDY7_9MAGN|nr:hypothetical protein IFM89_012238 [Coptis chinensis]
MHTTDVDTRPFSFSFSFSLVGTEIHLRSIHFRRTLTSPFLVPHFFSLSLSPSLLMETNRAHPYNGREDVWSEGATGTLIEAWGNRYLQLSRGNLRQKDWQDVSDAVNSRQDAVNKPRKTDVQCKNRVDTIKKKYKLERIKPGGSNWHFYTRMDELIGANLTPSLHSSLPKLPPLPPPSVTFTLKSNPSFRRSPSVVVYSGSDGEMGRNEVGKDEGFRELAKAIVKFGEIYERIETSKQEQIMELEKQRMEFTKDLEFQRMKMFMEAQLQLEKTKRPKNVSASGEINLYKLIKYGLMLLVFC